MLQEQVSGKIDSWAVRFYVSMFLNDGLFLYPQYSFVDNIGLDGSGVHCEPINLVTQNSDGIFENRTI